MQRLKNLFIALMVLFAFSPVSALAQSSQPSSGYVEIKVVDQNGDDIGGNWYLYPGQGSEGPVVRNGTLGETFSVPDGYYYLKGERKAGYSHFEVTSENPQRTIPRGTITFTLVYTEEPAPYTLPEETMMPEDEAPAEDDGAAVMEEEVVAPEAEEEDVLLEELLEEEEETPRLPDRSLLPERTPLHVDPPADSESATVATEAEEESTGMGGPVSLAVTGPESLLALLALSGMGGYFCCIRRRRA